MDNETLEKIKEAYRLINNTLNKQFIDRNIVDGEDYYRPNYLNLWKDENIMQINKDNYKKIMFKQLAISLQNTGHMSRSIKLDFSSNIDEYVIRTKEITNICHLFDLKAFCKEFKDYKALYSKFEKSDKGTKESKENGLSNVQKYCRGLFQGAHYINKIDFDNFSIELSFKENTISNSSVINELVKKIKIIQDNIKGFGFALACDWLKEIGCEWLAKPDVHIKEICKAIKPELEKAKDEEYIKFMNEMAIANEISTYKLDKMM